MSDSSHAAAGAEQDTPPVVFIYDRATTPNRTVFQRRLEACGQYAREQGWEIGGWFTDSGSEALSSDRRPGLDALLETMRQVKGMRPRFLLVHDRTRLHNLPGVQVRFEHMVDLAGGKVCTVADVDTPYRDDLTALAWL